MDYFPIFLRLTGEPVLVVGGGALAARKIDLLLRTSAKVTVAAPTLTASLARQAEAGLFVHIGTEFQPAYLQHMRLAIAATDQPSVNAWVARQARLHNVPVNVVNDRELSGFIMPASAALERRIGESLSNLPRPLRTTGEVALVGAGPGDPELLTLRALRTLQNADVVVYDRLVSDEVLGLARRDADRVFVGKTAGEASVPQEQINRLLVELAQQGKRVCRLKGGDPFIFGRGGEELQALAAHGVRFEVVPGITAAAGCAAYAGIPLTHRDHAQVLTFVTGHVKDGRSGAERAPDTGTAADMAPDMTPDMDWAALARPGQTCVFYMGLAQLENIIARLRAQGAPAQRPAAVVQDGTRPTQRVLTGTLGDLAAKVREAGMRSPAMLIVGEVAGLQQALHWFNAPCAAVNDVFAEARITEGRLIA